ncbi:MAG: transposase [Victivallales bacterium]
MQKMLLMLQAMVIHVVFIPKYRKQTLHKELRQCLGGFFRNLAHNMGSEAEEPEYLCKDHLHMCNAALEKREHYSPIM